MRMTCSFRRVGILLFLVSWGATETLGSFSISGREIRLDGSVFQVRGVCYQPAPIGEDVSAAPPYGDYYTAGYEALWDRDFANLRLMGANVIRIYGWATGADHQAFLDAAYNDGDQSLYVLINKWINPATDWGNTNAVNALVEEWVAIADSLKDHPAVMGFLIGNETNGQNGNGYKTDFWAAMNRIAGAMKAVAPDKLVSVAITDALDQVQSRDALMTNLDLWSLQIYRGAGFGSFFSDYAARSSKPLVVTEFGYDAYDAALGGEFADGAVLPADAMEYLWSELRNNRSVASGGCVFEYADEWWKAGSPYTHDAPTGWTAPFVDGEGNEEWWGLFRVLDNGSAPDRLEPRAMFYRLAAMWCDPFIPAFDQVGQTNALFNAGFSVPYHLRDQRVELEISGDLSAWTPIAGNLNSYSPTVIMSTSESNENVLVSATHEPAASGVPVPPNLLAYGDFEPGCTMGWITSGSASPVVSRDGSHSLRLNSSGGFSLPMAFQAHPAAAGEEYNLSGFMYTPVVLPADATYALLKIIFEDADGTDLPPASIAIGQSSADPVYPGAESVSRLNASSPVGSWIFSEVQAVAPSNTTRVSFFIIDVDQSANTMYFDSMQAVEVTKLPDVGSGAFFRLINSGR
ncbi:MAG: cellulase family glycosylhydrolase [Pontiellaceae bacterium]|nr:cellulase family glycosylhydrolase [Pontiellaceae bacterium]MBN2784506.1 cellulase family glycosylhydrolase [Pontiellaceae bacterium]